MSSESSSSPDDNHSSNNQEVTDGGGENNNNYLPPIKHEWVIENYPKTMECMFATTEKRNRNCKNCKDCDCHKTTTVPKMRSFRFSPYQTADRFREMRAFLGREHHPLHTPTESRSIDYNYGPFTIGATKWSLKLRMPSFELFLKRTVDRPGDGLPAPDEHLEFRVSMEGHVECKDGVCTNHSTSTPLPEFPKEHTFTAAANNEKVCLGRLPPEARGYSRICLTFEALVRHENYAMGALCDFHVVVLHPNEKEERVLAEFPTHRSVLSKGSPVFRAMLGEDSKFEEAKTGVVKIGNFAPETVKRLLGFIYVGRMIMTDIGQIDSGELLLELVDAAEQYQVDRALKIICSYRLVRLLSCENALKMLAKAVTYDLGELKTGAMRFIHKNRRRICLPENKEAMKQLLPVDLIIDLLNMNAQA